LPRSDIRLVPCWYAGTYQEIRIAPDGCKRRSTALYKSSEDYKNVKSVGKSTVELMGEFIETGKCQRLEELQDESFEEKVTKCVLNLGEARRRAIICTIKVIMQVIGQRLTVVWLVECKLWISLLVGLSQPYMTTLRQIQPYT